MIQTGKEIDRFESFIRSGTLPENIENLPGINFQFRKCTTFGICAREISPFFGR